MHKDTGVLLIGLQGRRMGNASYGDPRGGRYVGETRGWKRHGQGTHVYSGGGEAFVAIRGEECRGHHHSILRWPSSEGPQCVGGRASDGNQQSSAAISSHQQA